VSAEFDAEPAAGASLDGVLSQPPSNAPEASPAPFVAATAGAIPAAPDALLPGDDSRQPRIYGMENETARIVLRARLDSWVQVFAADESLILTRVLQPGDSYRVPDLAGLTLVTGNAGGLEIEVDGATVPPLGPVGAIRRGIALDAERLLEGTALAR
jgi:cytoskeleton protein RodZ